MSDDMKRIQDDLLEAAEFAYRRLRNRLTGLTDEEYFWEPAPGCWSVRRRDDGTWRQDRSRMPVKPAPLTTIAWRLSHLIDVLAGERNATWIGATPVGTLERTGDPATAADAIEQLERSYQLFTGNVGAAEAAGLTTPMGEAAGPYATHTRAAFVLHELDELVHHGSEIAAMRDVYAVLAASDPFVDAALTGDRAAIEAAVAADPAVRDRHAAILARVAAHQRWDTVRLLIDLGFDVNASAGVTALHYAAGAGELPIVRLLLDKGADPAVRDTEFNHPPVEWARFFGQHHAVDLLQ